MSWKFEFGGRGISGRYPFNYFPKNNMWIEGQEPFFLKKNEDEWATESLMSAKVDESATDKNPDASLPGK